MTVNAGVDLHKTQFTVCMPKNGKQVFERYPATDSGYADFLRNVKRRQGAGKQVRAGVESTGNTRYFKSVMDGAGGGVKVINTLKFKAVNEPVKKTDKHDAAAIAEFLEKDMLPEARLCSETSGHLRRLLKVRTALVVKNQIHALLTAIGMADEKASLQSKKGRQRVLDAFNERENGLVGPAVRIQPLFETIEKLEENVKRIEAELEKLTEKDAAVELLLTIPGCGKIGAWTIRAYTGDIKRFASAKKYAAYAGLVPRVQNSNETVHYGRITKRGPEELRTALVQVVLGMRRSKKQTLTWRLMARYEALKPAKGSGKSIIATARKVAAIIWVLLQQKTKFDVSRMTDKKLARKAASMQAAHYKNNPA